MVSVVVFVMTMVFGFNELPKVAQAPGVPGNVGAQQSLEISHEELTADDMMKLIRIFDNENIMRQAAEDTEGSEVCKMVTCTVTEVTAQGPTFETADKTLEFGVEGLDYQIGDTVVLYVLLTR